MDLDTASAPVVDSAPLSIEAAVKHQQTLRAKGATRVEDPEPEEQPETEAREPVEGDTESDLLPQADQDVEGEPEQANAEDDNAAPPEPETAIEPPQFWDAEGKERFAKLSPASQKEVVEYEKQRTAAVAKAMQKAAETTKQSEAKLKQLQEAAERIGDYVDAQSAHMQAWEQWLESDAAQELAVTNSTAYNAELARYDREKREYEKVLASKAEAEQVTYRTFIEEQRKLLPEIAPELADPKEGPQRMKDTMTYLGQRGIPAEQVRGISALEASIAYKAMLWDRAQAKAKEQPKPKPKPAGPTAPAAGQGVRASSSETRIKQLNSMHSLTVEQAMELRRLKRG